jgi:hypothetical protein
MSSSHFIGDTVEVDEGVKEINVCWLSRRSSGDDVSSTGCARGVGGVVCLASVLVVSLD